MGLFSSRKKTYVSSVLYNLAGDDERPEILKSMVMGNMIRNPDFSVTRALQQGYANGQGMKLRGFYNWAKSNYTEVGIPTDSIQGTREVSISGVEAAIGEAVGKPVKLEWAEASRADAAYWAMKWMYEYLPERVDDEWTADADPAGEGYEIVINFADGVTAPIVLTITDYDPTQMYICARYQSDEGASTEPAVTGEIVDLGANPLPSVVGWDLYSSVLVAATKRLDRVVNTTAVFSDGRPNEVSTKTTGTNETYDVYRAIYTRKTYQGVGADGRQTSLQEFMVLTQDRSVSVVRTTEERVENLPDGVTKTITDVIDQDTLQMARTSQVNTQLVIHAAWGKPKIFIYRHGSGHAGLDAMITGKSGTVDGYFPLIPLRLNNAFVNENNFPELYAQSKKAYKKALGGKFDEIIDKLGDNESLGDIDFAYVVFGVTLNTKENACRKYIYNYFSRFLRQQPTTSGDYAAWSVGTYDAYVADKEAWDAWMAAQQAAQGTNVGIGGGGPSEPRTGTYTTPPATSAQIKTSDKDINFNMEIIWQSITETRGTGLAKEDAKPGDVWLVGANAVQHPFFDRFNNLIEDMEVGDTQIIWQETTNSWKKLTIKGLQHKNHIWNGKFVETGATEALADEEESSFIIPLHADVFKKMSMVDATQMSTSCAYLVLNCYQIVKKKWYQRGFFKVLLIIAVIVITIYTGGLGAGSAGILGTFGGVGAALGFTGIIGVIVGAIANMVAAMILTRIITTVAVQFLGEELGAIIGAIASFIALSAGSLMQAGQSLSSLWPSLMRVENLLSLTNSVGNGIAGVIQGDAQSYAVRTQELMEDYNRESKELAERYAAEFGYGSRIFDPMALTGVGEFFNESEAAFLSRTLMTGSDIAEMSMDMVTSFTDLTLDVDLHR